MASLIKNWRTTSERIDKFISDDYFTDVNINNMINVDVLKLPNIYHLNKSTIPIESTKESLELFDRLAMTFNEVISDENEWQMIDVSTFTFGPTWSIHWFRLEFVLPTHWAARGADYVVELQWKSGCEAMVYSRCGAVVQGLNSINARTSVDMSYLPAPPDGRYVVYLQTSCSDLFGGGQGGLLSPPTADRTFRIELAKLRLLFRPAVMLRRDLRLLLQLAQELKDTERGYEALFVANGAVNCVVGLQQDDVAAKIARARAAVDAFLDHGRGRPQRAALYAMGHCHIDTAWLWRYGETRRKIARSWATTLRLLERYPHMTFVCSQAQQLDWLRHDYPDLFAQLQAMARRHQFIPVGGTWVEMDVNLPCAESLCRQFLYGQRFFKDAFGQFCTEFWLPDTFGYSPQLPQIMQQSRLSRFVTQKLSWSLVNKFPHHTFLWEGLDGSTVLTHFPPGNDYSMTGTVAEMLRSATNFADKGRSSSMMYLYGHGDGGQGPKDEMVYSLDRLADCDGLPRICHSSPDKMFSQIEGTDIDKLCRWKGELFLELHNGTYTTQRQLKLGNTHCEQMLRAVELLLSIALCQPIVSQGDPPGHERQLMAVVGALEAQWKQVLLGQFHDVLPGSSIELVCDDAYWSHRAVLAWCVSVIRDLVSLLGLSTPFVINPTSWPMEVPLLCGDDIANARRASYYVPPHSVADYSDTLAGEASPELIYTFDEGTQLHRLENIFFRITVDSHCRIRSLQLSSAPGLTNLFPDGCPANQLVMYDDVPLYWDAWDVMDYHLETGANIDTLPSFRLTQEARLTPSGDDHLLLVAKFCLDSTGTVIEQSVKVHRKLEYVQLCTKIVEWHESHRIIKVRVPTIAKATEAQYRTQVGYHSRPTHRNTSWDTAKFEVCGHEWVHIGEANWGISVLKDSVFGSSAVDGTIFLSLLRSPNRPDPTADKKHLPHIFNYAIYPYDSPTNTNRLATTTRLASQFVWSSAWETNYPPQVASSYTTGLNSGNSVKLFPIHLASPTNGEVAIDWIKPSCDDPRKFVIRLHEQIGGRYSIKLFSSRSIRNVSMTNILEEYHLEASGEINFTANSIEMFILPFKIVSIIVEFFL